jgi:Helix-turn-helix of DDE superfamily endonuclease
VLSYPAGMTVSNRALIMLSDLLRHHRSVVGTRWPKLEPGQHALLVLAHLRKGDTYAELAAGFAVGTTTVYRYLHEAIELLAARAPTLEQAIEVARGKAFVTLNGTLLAAAAVSTIADTAYQGAGPAVRIPQRRRRRDPDTGRYRSLSAAQKHVNGCRQGSAPACRRSRSSV